MNERLIIFDTTLRDGEQSPGCSLDTRQKTRFAQALAQLGVDVIEAGYPAASEGDFRSVHEIAANVEGASICALARCNEADIRAAGTALLPARRPRIHVFIAASPIHRQHKLRLSRLEVIERAVAGVRHARDLVADVEFSAEDATRAEPDFLIELFAQVIAAGASTINVPDTVGYTTPSEYADLIHILRLQTPGIDGVRISAHCHDDLGLAVANSLAAVDAGARQVECTITGIGERAGNACLEEIVMAIKTRPDRYGVHSGVITPRLYSIARLLASLIGTSVPRNKAIVGDNAFAHESGIHQHGMIAERSTYEIMHPEDVGFPGSQLVLGKHSGRAAVRDRLARLGYVVTDPAVDSLMGAYKRLADKKKEIFDADLESLWLGIDPAAPAGYALESLQVTTSIGSRSEPTASIALRNREGLVRREAAIGDGPIDAIANALARATGLSFDLLDYQVRSLTSGMDAQGQATVRLMHEDREYRGQGSSTDVMEASAIALLDAVNKVASTSNARAHHLAALTAHTYEVRS